jgi:hypothetical protein
MSDFVIPISRWDADMRVWVQVPLKSSLLGDAAVDDEEGAAGSGSDDEHEEGCDGSDNDVDDLVSSDSSIELAVTAHRTASMSLSSLVIDRCNISLVNWNVWFADVALQQRFERLLAIIRALDPTIVCLQVPIQHDMPYHVDTSMSYALLL